MSCFWSCRNNISTLQQHACLHFYLQIRPPSIIKSLLISHLFILDFPPFFTCKFDHPPADQKQLSSFPGLRLAPIRVFKLLLPLDHKLCSSISGQQKNLILKSMCKFLAVFIWNQLYPRDTKNIDFHFSLILTGGV